MIKSQDGPQTEPVHQMQHQPLLENTSGVDINQILQNLQVQVSALRRPQPAQPPVPIFTSNAVIMLTIGCFCLRHDFQRME